mmetsp:Transcript_57937/g.127027  ORF Transcript_57937/g.127027 Transcript_57937/m.127027 type:complete len:127 (+) Transcript_57937:96-476(+)
MAAAAEGDADASEWERCDESEWELCDDSSEDVHTGTRGDLQPWRATRRRRDPWVGDVVTFDELLARNAGSYTRPEISEYWQLECEEVSAAEHDAVEALSAAAAVAAKEEEWSRWRRSWERELRGWT